MKLKCVFCAAGKELRVTDVIISHKDSEMEL